MAAANLTPQVEFWKVVPNWPTYQVSIFGEVKGPRRVVRRHVNNTSDLSVTLRDGCRSWTVLVRRLVVLAFHGESVTRAAFKHADGDKMNCRIENLWPYNSLDTIDLLGEEWREFSGYRVSNFGRVIGRDGIRDLCDDAKGYKRLQFYVEGKLRTYAVHQLVAMLFIGPCPDGLQVNHKDGKKWRNHVGNLEYVTPRENMLHSYRTLGRIARNGWMKAKLNSGA